MLNRCVVTVRGREPFLQWLKSLPDPVGITLKRVNQDTTAYLLPEYAFDDEHDEPLEHFYDLIFKEQLEAWWIDESAWPVQRDLATFKKWFTVMFHSVVLDLAEEPLVYED